MSRAETERFYGEYRGLGRLIGVRERDLPETWPQFCVYFRRTARSTRPEHLRWRRAETEGRSARAGG